MGDDGTVTWAELHEETRERLARSDVDAGPNEARWIIERAAGARLEEAADRPATERGVAHLDAMVERRTAGEPLQYVLGRWAFRTLELFVDRRVLIPRPETEVVAGVAVEEALGRGRGCTVVDLGTGSGAIALSVAAECRGAEVWATDRSPEALEVARANTAGLGMRGASVRLAEGDWFEALPGDLRGRVDVVVSNPPYVATGEELPEQVRAWEPTSALYAGPDGLDDLRELVRAAPAWLSPGGAVVFELDPRQVVTVTALLTACGFEEVSVVPDLTGRDRAIRATWSERAMT